MENAEMTSDFSDGKNIVGNSFVGKQNLIKKAYIQNSKEVTKYGVGIDTSSVALENAVDMNEDNF